MKLAPITPASERQVRRERLRRNRALAPALRAAYPTVQQLRFDLNFRAPHSTSPAMQSHTLHAAARAFFEFPCPYADCDGQFDLSGAVTAALANLEHRASGVLVCSGSHAVRGGAHDLCRLQLDFTITATVQANA